MGLQAKNLTIIFREIQPEQLYHSIREEQPYGKYKDRMISVDKIDETVFQSLAHAQYPMYSHEEIGNVYSILCEQMRPPNDHTPGTPSVFHLLVGMGRRVLHWRPGSAPICEFSEIFPWRNAYQDLGQDIITTAYLAYEDLCKGGFVRSEFSWSPVLRTNNDRLNRILAKGLAENHCHLGGTSQNFPVTWACLMNHVDAIRSTPSWLKANLLPHFSRGVSGNVWSWEERLTWAAWLRLQLFWELESQTTRDVHKSGIKSCIYEASFDKNRCFYPIRELKSGISSTRFLFGACVSVPHAKADILDYALRREDCKNGLIDHPNRLLSGERSFLYRCFRACFDGTFDRETQDWFYLYLLIKENFRAEMIQVNRQVGFYNFMEYQARKDVVFDSFPAYQAEAVRLSINANQLEQAISRFEVRIAPKSTPNQMRSQIQRTEDFIKAGGPQLADHRVFYVYHFIKFPDHGEFRIAAPRNHAVRRDCRTKAEALAYALQSDSIVNKRVVGIDAANLEIGCRPEVFATAFRFLRSLSPRKADAFAGQKVFSNIHVTYHVGEDFLDIADGLRAIDEAIRFLLLGRGDRVGHALALGIDPELHYTFKRNRIILPKQDLLDNLVWLYFRAQELRIPITAEQRGILQYRAEELLYEIYGPCFQGQLLRQGAESRTLHEYYCAMKLRGDDPSLYFNLPFERPNAFSTHGYDLFRLTPDKSLDNYRNLDTIAYLYHVYHFNRDVRERGKQAEAFLIRPAYVSLIRKVQDRLAEEMANRGIQIECNPTSNYLIGTFRRYDRHPIIRFNNSGLIRCDGTHVPAPQLSVSINTDDLGIFDTTLGNEYAMLAAALGRMEIQGKPLYSIDSLYQYLEHVREMGFEQSFWKA